MFKLSLATTYFNQSERDRKNDSPNSLNKPFVRVLSKYVQKTILLENVKDDDRQTTSNSWMDAYHRREGPLFEY